MCVCVGGGEGGEGECVCVCVQLYERTCRWEEGGGASEIVHEEWKGGI